MIGFLKLASGLLAVILGIVFVRFVVHDPGESIKALERPSRPRPQQPLDQSAHCGDHRHQPDSPSCHPGRHFFLRDLAHDRGRGLILEYDWAGYLVVVATGSLIPFEIYEIAQKHSPVRIGILIVNIGIVIYLIVQLRKHHAARERKRAAKGVFAPR